MGLNLVPHDFVRGSQCAQLFPLLEDNDNEENQ